MEEEKKQMRAAKFGTATINDEEEDDGDNIRKKFKKF